MSVDFPRAWQISQSASMKKHHPKCSYRQTDGALLCDCDVLYKHPELVDDILQTLDGVVIDDKGNDRVRYFC
jgi:hypothetical protein